MRSVDQISKRFCKTAPNHVRPSTSPYRFQAAAEADVTKVSYLLIMKLRTAPITIIISSLSLSKAVFSFFVEFLSAKANVITFLTEIKKWKSP